jgi:tetratricopeptide (TPR) repeat protein
MPIARLATVLLLALVGTSLEAQSPQIVSKAPWFEVQSRNFRVVGNADRKRLRDIAVDLEEIRRQFFAVFPKEADYRLQTTVVAFRNDKNLLLFYQPGGGGKPRAGYVHTGLDRNYIAINAGQKRRRSVYHDYVHSLMEPYNLPAWLSEGLAEYYGSIENERYLIGEYRTVLLGSPIRDHERHLRNPLVLPLDELLNAGEYSHNDNMKTDVFLAESWALVHMLHLHLEDSLKHWIQALVDGNPAKASFDRIFRFDPGLAEEALRNYVQSAKQMGWTYKRIPYCMCDSSPNDWLQFNFDRTQTFVKENGERKLSEAEIRFYLGDLMLHRGQVPEAEAFLLDALRLNPDLAAAHASLSVIRIQEGRHQEAKQSIQRALALATDNPLPYLFYARLIQLEARQTGVQLTAEELGSMQVSLLKAARLGPHLDDAIEMLVEVNEALGEPEMNHDPRILRPAKRPPGVRIRPIARN